MLKIIQSIVLTLALIITSSAQAGSNLKVIIDELDYSLTVEWDQVDPQFYNDQISHFESALINEGITKLDLLTYIQNEPIYADLSVDPIVNSLLLDTNLSEIEAHALILQLMPKMYKKGASWVGGIDVLAWSWGIAIVVLTVGVISYCNKKKDGIQGPAGPAGPTDARNSCF